MNKKELIALLTAMILSVLATANADAEQDEPAMTEDEARVFLADRYANGIGHDDVTAGEAAAGDVAEYELTVANDSSDTVCNILAWLDASAEGSAYLELSDDGVSWSSPTTEPTGVALGNIVAAGSATLYARRTIPAAEPFDPAVLTHLHFGFDNRS